MMFRHNVYLLTFYQNLSVSVFEIYIWLKLIDFKDALTLLFRCYKENKFDRATNIIESTPNQGSRTR